MPKRRESLQSFAEKADSAAVKNRISELRSQLKELGLDAFIVPRADQFQGESVPAGAERLAWLTGFTGSAGSAIVTLELATLFVDTRYTLQAPAQTDTSVFDIIESPPARISDWIKTHLDPKSVIGFDPQLMTKTAYDSLITSCPDHILKPVINPIDTIWGNERPGRPAGQIEFLGTNRAGIDATTKLEELTSSLEGARLDAIMLTLPESLCWLFNMRGNDIPNTPVTLGYAYVPQTGLPQVFVVADKITPEATRTLNGIAELCDIDTLQANLAARVSGKTIAIDPANCPINIVDILTDNDATLRAHPDWVVQRKARKNDVELAGMREAHLKDGIAMAKFLHWIDAHSGSGTLTEIDIVKQLESFRKEDETLVDISFDTICGAGPNGAIVHYRVTENTNRTLSSGEILLVDSGGQYLSGTTDITRTMATGDTTQEQRDRYTRVLKGMIGISRLRFPHGTNGGQIDIIARQYLWADGATYNHGTGHGVGAYLGVHEGPVGISPRYKTAFEPGHIVSNEPGYYQEDGFGIRIENLIHVMPSAHEGFLEFETLTLAPIDTRLIEKSLLNDDEINWLNDYHANVFKQIAPHLKSDCKAWLRQVTQPL